MINRLIYIALLASSTSLISSGQQGQKKYCMPPKIGFERPVLPSGLALAKNDTDANKADKEYTDESPKWFEEYRGWYPNAMWKKDFTCPASALGVLDRSLGNPISKITNRLLYPINRYQEYQKRQIDSRYFWTLESMSKDFQNKSESLKFFPFYRYWASEKIFKEDKDRGRSQKALDYFARNCSDYHLTNDFGVSVDTLIGMYGLRNLSTILVKNEDIDAIAKYAQSLVRYWRDNDGFFQCTIQNPASLSEDSISHRLNKADTLVSLVDTLILSKHAPGVYNYGSAVSSMGIYGRLCDMDEYLRYIERQLDSDRHLFMFEQKRIVPVVALLLRLKKINIRRVRDLRARYVTRFERKLQPSLIEKVARGEELSDDDFPQGHWLENIYYLDLLENDPFATENIEWLACRNAEKLLDLQTCLIKNKIRRQRVKKSY